jgi:hypothetical protein
MSVHPIARIASLVAIAGLQMAFIGAARADDAAPADCSGPKTREQVIAELHVAQHSSAWKYLNSNAVYPWPADQTPLTLPTHSTACPASPQTNLVPDAIHSAAVSGSLADHADEGALYSN